MPIPTVLANAGRGLLMGGADVIPGVSGGTVALILGIYERLIRSVRNGASGIVAFGRGDRAGGRRRFGDVEWRLVLPLAAGILTAIAIGSRVLPPLLEHYQEPVSALFFGLILGSVAIPLRRIERLRALEISLIVGFALAAFVLVGLPPREILDPPLPLVFAAAAVAICAMILPGISGAFLLLVFGIYRPTLEALRGLDLAYIATFAAGAAIGLGSFSRLLEWLLERHHSTTMAALVGLMIGSLRALWPWLAEDRAILAPPDPVSFLVMAALAAAGVVAVLLLARYAGGGVAGRSEGASRP